jgi:hypothetical protein
MKKLKEALKCNQPRMTPSHPKKKAVVKGCEDGEEKLIRFGAKYWACKALWTKNSPKIK